MVFLPYGKQSLDENDIQAVVEALRSDWLTTGPMVQEFEQALARRVGVAYAVVFNSGTAALHAAYHAAGVKAGDEVITSPITFAATSNAALYLGAKPIFADIQSDTVNIDPNEIEDLITNRTRVIAPVDFAGHPADMDEIITLAKNNHIVVVEDAAHAIGAIYRGRSVGSMADITTFSFHPVKHITTGEGGAAVTNSLDYYEKMLAFRSHGIVRAPEKMMDNHGPWYYEMQELGYNYRLTDIQCSLGLSQLKKLDGFLERRQDIVDYYNGEFAGLDIQLPVTRPEVIPAWHLYIVRLKRSNPSRIDIYNKLQLDGIGVQVHYLPVYWHPYYREMGYEKGLCPVAEDYYQRTISLPLFPTMEEADARRVVHSIKEFIKW